MGKKPWDERTQPAIDEVHAVIKAAFPEAEFQVHQRGAPNGIYIDAYMKADNGFDVLDLIGDGLVDSVSRKGWASMWSLCSRPSPDHMLMGHRLPGHPSMFLRPSSFLGL
jgi:hypothetical protein